MLQKLYYQNVPEWDFESWDDYIASNPLFNQTLIYQTIIIAGTHKAESIKVAEAAKVIENIQRDINIALINELAMIFNKLDIDKQKMTDAGQGLNAFMSAMGEGSFFGKLERKQNRILFHGLL